MATMTTSEKSKTGTGSDRSFNHVDVGTRAKDGFVILSISYLQRMYAKLSVNEAELVVSMLKTEIDNAKRNLTDGE